jgi:hypothetical protein
MPNIDLNVSPDCYATAMDAYRDSILADIKSMQPINTEKAIKLAVDAALYAYIEPTN